VSDQTHPDSTEAPDEDRPATYREVFESKEYRAVFAVSTLSGIGDYFTKAAIAFLVFTDTGSALLTAVSLAISYLPWVVGGPVLAALAERYPYRRVMIICDIGRMVFVGLLVVPGMPLPVMLALLFASALLSPPHAAARSALLPQLLDGDRYVVAISFNNTAQQAAQVFGFFAGAVIAGFEPRLALAMDALTFGVSALVVAVFVRYRPAVGTALRRHLLRETAEGFGVVFGNRVLAMIAVVVFAAVAFAVVPEGLAAAWASDLSAKHHAWYQGMIMAAGPFGVAVGGLTVVRLAPSVRQRLIRPLTVLAPAVLVPALLSPPILVVVGLTALTGFVMAWILPPANGLFVQALPKEYRARAFGVMQGGLQISQGLAILATGTMAEFVPIPLVVGGWSLAGVLVMLVVGVAWPSRAALARAIAANKRINEAAAQSDELPAVPKAGVDMKVATSEAGTADAPANA